MTLSFSFSGPTVSLSLEVQIDCSGDNLKTLNNSLQIDVSKTLKSMSLFKKEGSP